MVEPATDESGIDPNSFDRLLTVDRCDLLFIRDTSQIDKYKACDNCTYTTDDEDDDTTDNEVTNTNYFSNNEKINDSDSTLPTILNNNHNLIWPIENEIVSVGISNDHCIDNHAIDYSMIAAANLNNSSSGEESDIEDCDLSSCSSYESVTSSIDETYILAREWPDDQPSSDSDEENLRKIHNKYYNRLVVGWFPSECNSPFLGKLWPSVLKLSKNGSIFSTNHNLIEMVLENEPRDCLLLRTRRRELVDSFKPLIDACTEPVNIASNIVKSIIDYHQIKLNENCNVCRLGKYHDILYIAVTLAAEYNVYDSELISQLIECLYKCEGGLDRIIVPAVLGPKLAYVLSGWCPDFDNAEDARDAFAYFINHTTAVKLLIQTPSGDLVRMIDSPLVTLQGSPAITAAVQSGDTEAIAMLLTYGATTETELQFCPVRAAFNKISHHASAFLGLRDPCICVKQLLGSSNRIHPQQVHPLTEIESFFNQINCQDIYELCPCELNFPIPWAENEVTNLLLLSRSASYYKFLQSSDVLHLRVIADGLVNLNPRTLRHMCCDSIRNRIRENWGLPNGIYQLGLPAQLSDYLSLSKDVCSRTN